jgi:hypothetical protein
VGEELERREQASYGRSLALGHREDLAFGVLDREADLRGLNGLPDQRQES